MGNLCSKYLNFKTSNKNDLKNKLIKDSSTTSTEESEKNISSEKLEQNKKNIKSHKKKHKKNKEIDSESESSDNDSYDEVKNNSNISDSLIEKEKKKVKRRKKKKNIKKKIKKDESDSTESENSEISDSESEEYETKKHKKQKKIKIIKKIIKEELEYENLKNKIKDLKMSKENINSEIIKNNEITKIEISTIQKEEEKKEEEKEEQKITKTDTKFIDLPQKKKLTFYLLQNDYIIYKKHLLDVQKLSDEEFNELFEGNTDYKNFNVPNQTEFIQLVQKFDDNKDLIIQWYNEEKYYEIILQFWKQTTLLQQLKEKKTKEEKYDLLKQKKIDSSKWDENFSVYFDIIINKPSIKSYAQRMKNYIKADYGNFDELIKTVDKCESNLNKNENLTCKYTFKADIDVTLNKLIGQFVPSFIANFKEGYNKFQEDKNKKQEEIAKDKIIEYKNDYEYKNSLYYFEDDFDDDSIDYLEGLSEKNKKLLTEEVRKMYKNENDNSEIDMNELEKINELSKKLNEDGEKICQMEFLDKSKMLFENDKIKNSILGLSITNCVYSVIHLGKTILEFKMINEFESKFNEIKSNFEKHKNEVPLIDEDDIDNAINQIIELGKKFQKDLDDINNLIKEINNKIIDQNNELNKTYLNLGISIVGLGISFFASSLVENNREYNISGGSNVTAIILNVTDIQMQNKLLKDMNDILIKAQNLKSEIMKKIEELKNKFDQLSHKHYS